MANGFWKKVAGAFVVDEDAEQGTEDSFETTDLDAEAADTEALLRSIDTPPATPPVVVPKTSAEVEEGRPFADFYAESEIAKAPYPAEKLLKVLEGLQAMPPETRRAAIGAMDGADDDWTIADPVLDAQRKIKCLQSVQSGLTATIQAAEARASQELQESSSYLEQATATIHKQIAELEQLLESERQSIAQRKLQIQERADGVRAAVRREDARLSSEVARLQQIPLSFAASENASAHTADPS